MSISRGKSFEGVVRACFERVPDTHVKRLYDVQGGKLGIANECDFYVFRSPNQYLIECKSIHGNTMSINSNDPKKKYGIISNTQWEGMLKATETKNVVAGVLVWFVDHDITLFVPIQRLQSIKDDGMKSIKYDINFPDVIKIEGTKKRIFFDYDFESFFRNFEKSC